MKKLLIAITFLLITIFVNRYTDVVIDINTITLIGMGLALFVAFSFAELGKVIGLPMVTGFILTGLALGPELGNLLSLDVVNRLKMFNTLAIGIIALSAGIELDLKTLGKDVKSLSSTIFGKIFFLFLFIAPVVYFYESNFQFFGHGEKEKIVMAILFSVFGIGTSPAIVLAILSETKAKGRISNLVLNNAILKDFVVVVVLAVALGFCTAFLSGSNVSVDSIVNLVGREIGLSLALGLIFGAIIIFYMKHVNVDTLLFIVAMILVVAEISKIYHLEFLLVLIGAGALVKNTTDFADDLHHVLMKVSLPVFIIFFTNAGAAIQVSETLRILPLALLIVSVRGFAMYCSAKISSKMTLEKPNVEKNIWLGYIPQAGVTLGLIEIAAQRIPSLSTDLYLLGIGVVSLNLIVGPIALKIALKRANEIPEEKREEKDVSHSENNEKIDIRLALPRFENIDYEQTIGNSEFNMPQYHVLESLVLDFFKDITNDQQRLLHAYIQNVSQVTSGFIENNTFENNEEKKHEYTCKNVKNIGFLYHSLNVDFISQLQQSYKKIISKIPVKSETKFIRNNLFYNGVQIQDVPLQILIKTFTRVEYSTYCIRLFEKMTVLLGNSLAHYFEDGNSIDLQIISQRLDRIMRGEILNLNNSIKSCMNENLLSAVENGVIKKQSLSKTNVRALTLEDGLKSLILESSKYFESLSNYKCLRENEKFFKERITTALHSIFYQDLSAINVEIKNNSAPVFIVIEKLKKVFSGSENVLSADVENFDFDEELIGVGIKINPYLLENKFKLELRNISKQLVNIDLLFDTESTKSPERLSELKYKKVDLATVVRQLEVLEFLPKIERQLEELFEVIERVKFDYVEAVGLVKSFSKTATDLSEQVRRTNLQQLDIIRRSLSTELANLAEAYNEFVHGSSKLSLSTIDSLDIKIYQGKLAANTVGKVGYAINFLKESPKYIVPIFYKHIRAVLYKIVEETSVIHSPDKILFNRGRVRSVSKDFKLKIDSLLSLVLFKRNTDINDFYRECFSLEPIRSSNNMITNKKVLGRIFEHEEEWQKTGHLKMIVIHGPTGSGKTSLLNVLQNEMGTQDILRISDDYDSKRNGLYALILNYLKITRREYKIILIDNIDQWVKKSNKSEEDFKKFINLLMLNKDKNLMVVCTINKLNVDFLNSTYNLDLLASRTYTLEEMSLSSLKELVEYRQWQSGQTLDINKALNLPFYGQKLHFDSIIRKIIDQSKSVRGCLTLWLSLTSKANDGLTIIDSSKDYDLEEFEMLISYLPNEVYLVYRYFFHFGESNIQEITRSLMLDRDHVSRCLNYLVNAGILDYNSKCHRYDLDSSIRSILETKFINNLVMREGENYGNN